MKEHEKYTAIPHPWADFTQLWQTRQLSIEQAIEQLLVWGQLQDELMLKYKRELEEQKRSVADLAAQVAEAKGEGSEADGDE